MNKITQYELRKKTAEGKKGTKDLNIYIFLGK